MKKLIKIFLILPILIGSLSHAIEESSYQENLEKKVIPYYKNNAKIFTLKVDGKDVVGEYISNGNSKLLVIFPGRTEPAKKYQEVVYDLKDSGYDFLLVNHRAQGLSERLLKDQQKGHIKNFDHYVISARAVIERTLTYNKNYSHIVLLAHSMGNLIGLKLHQESPNLFDKMILSSPMLDILTGDFSETKALALTRILTYTGFSAKYVMGHGPHRPQDNNFEGNKVTHSPVRWSMARKLEEENPFLIMGGATNRWTYQSIKHSRQLEKDFSELKPVPVLMFTAGKEFYVKNERAKKLCEQFGNQCHSTHFPDALHELFQEKDLFRDDVMRQIKNFL